MARTAKTNKEAAPKVTRDRRPQTKRRAEKKVATKPTSRQERSSQNATFSTYWHKFWHSFAGDFAFPRAHTTETTEQKTGEPFIRFLPFFSVLALVLALLGAFALGHAQSSCVSNYASNIGTLKVITVMTPKNNFDAWSLFSFLPSTPKVQKPEDLLQTQRVILVNPQGESLTVIHPGNMNLASFDNKNVIITGQVSPCTKTVTLDVVQNLTPLFQTSGS